MINKFLRTKSTFSILERRLYDFQKIKLSSVKAHIDQVWHKYEGLVFYLGGIQNPRSQLGGRGGQPKGHDTT